MSVLGDDEKDKEAENNYSYPNGNVCSNLVQSDLHAAEGWVHVAAVGDDDDVLDRSVVEEGRVTAAETGWARALVLVWKTGSPVHEAGL